MSSKTIGFRGTLFSDIPRWETSPQIGSMESMIAMPWPRLTKPSSFDDGNWILDQRISGLGNIGNHWKFSGPVATLFKHVPAFRQLQSYEAVQAGWLAVDPVLRILILMGCYGILMGHNGILIILIFLRGCQPLCPARWWKSRRTGFGGCWALSAKKIFHLSWTEMTVPQFPSSVDQYTHIRQKDLHLGLSENRLNPIVPNGFADQTIPFL